MELCRDLTWAPEQIVPVLDPALKRAATDIAFQNRWREWFHYTDHRGYFEYEYMIEPGMYSGHIWARRYLYLPK